jgi:hypothetical protein
VVITPAVIPTPPTASEQIDPLDRPVLSNRDYKIRDKDFTYVEPFFINQSSVNLSISGGTTPPATGAANPAALGNLAPSAGGNNLGDLAPSAGGLVGNKAVTCANASLDWNSAAGKAPNCDEGTR